MDVRRLELLLALSRQGSMHAVSGESRHHHLDRLAADRRAGEGGRRRCSNRTGAGSGSPRRAAGWPSTPYRSAAHEAARADLDRPRAGGTVRVAAFHTVIRDTLLPVVHELAAEYPAVRLEIQEQEPPEALALLERDQVDLALSYDYNLAPAAVEPALDLTPLWHSTWSLAVPSRSRRTTGPAADVLAPSPTATGS